jgi:hypothetical protein
MDPENETSKQYRLWLRLPGNAIGEVTGDDPAVVKDIAQRMANGGARFVPQTVSPTGSTLIFHPAYEGGKKPIGWIAAFDIPTSMTNAVLLEHLKQAA